MPVEGGTFNIELSVQESIDLLLEPSFTDEEILSQYQVIRNLYAGKIQLGLIQKMDKVVRKQQACSPKYAANTKISDRSVEVKYAEAGLKWCYEEFVNTYYENLAPLFTTQNGAVDLSELINLMLTLLQMAIRQDLERGAWFNDSASLNADYDWCDGFFKHLGELKALTNSPLGGVVDTQRGTDITGQTAYELLRDAHNNARPELRMVPAAQKRIHIDGNMWYKILNYLEEASISNGLIRVFNEPMAGIQATYRGIPIVPHHRWNDILLSDFNLDNQNLIVYTTADNLVIATDIRQNAVGQRNTSKIYQDPYTDALHIHSKFTFDTNYVFPKLIVYGN